MRSLEEELGKLDQALAASSGYFPTVHAEAEEVADRVRSRVRIGAEHTVVVFAGSTGSGKSSLVNRVVGRDVSRVAATRPTTVRALSLSSGGAEEVLDWMEVPSRLKVPNIWGEERLVVIDTPDLDSFEYSHRKAAAHLIQRADAVVFVLDPQKYADAVVHQEYLRLFSHHGATTVVVLNQVDTLSFEDRDAVVADLRRLLASEGIDARLIVTSAVTGQGIEELGEELLALVRQRDAMRLRLLADVRGTGEKLGRANAEAGGKTPRDELVDFSGVVTAVCAAAGESTIGEASARSYEARAAGKSGFDDPLVAWGVTKGTYVTDSSLGRVRREVEKYVREELDVLPDQWRMVKQGEFVSSVDSVVDDIKTRVASLNIEGRKPAWWSVTRWVSRGLLVAAVASLCWLLLYFLRDLVGIRVPQPPYYGIFSLPLIAAVVSFASYAFIRAGARRWTAVGARRARTRVLADFRKLCAERVKAQLVVPVREARGRYAEFYEALRAIGGL